MLETLAAFRRSLAELTQLVEDGDAFGLEAALARIKAAREHVA
jgi:prephenate dehydrogenase